MKHSRGPIAGESSTSLRSLLAGSPVYVYRTRSNSWEGPFPLIQIEGETVVLQLPFGRRIFRSNVVKPVVKSEIPLPAGSNAHAREETNDATLLAMFGKDGF